MTVSPQYRLEAIKSNIVLPWPVVLAQWLDCRPAHQRVAGSISEAHARDNQSTCLSQINVFSLSPVLPPFHST